MEAQHVLVFSITLTFLLRTWVFAEYCSSTDTSSVVQVCTSGSITGSYLRIDTRNVSSSATVCSCSVSLGGTNVQYIDYSGPGALGLCGIQFQINNVILSCQSTTIPGQTVNVIKYSQTNNPISTACLSMSIGGNASITCYESGVELPSTQTQSSTTTTTTHTTTTTPPTITTPTTTTTHTTTTTPPTTTTHTTTTTPPTTTTPTTTTTRTITTTPPTTTTRTTTTTPPTTTTPHTTTTHNITTTPPTTTTRTTKTAGIDMTTTNIQTQRETTELGTSSNQGDIDDTVGGILGGLVGIVLLAVLVTICVVKRRHLNKRSNDTPSQSIDVTSNFCDDYVMKTNPAYENAFNMETDTESDNDTTSMKTNPAYEDYVVMKTIPDSDLENTLSTNRVYENLVI